jgi:hypothetical protein
MKRAQVGLEAVLAAALVVLAYAAVLSLCVRLQGEAADRLWRQSWDGECRDLAALIDGVYSGGPGVSGSIVLLGNYSVGSGFVASEGLGNVFYCPFSPAAVGGVSSVYSGNRTVANRGGVVEVR